MNQYDLGSEIKMIDLIYKKYHDLITNSNKAFEDGYLGRIMRIMWYIEKRMSRKQRYADFGINAEGELVCLVIAKRNLLCKTYVII